MNQKELIDKFFGVLLGVVIGDTLGLPYENFPDDMVTQIPKNKEIKKGDKYSDDSEMTLNGLNSIVFSKGIDSQDLAIKYSNFNKNKGYGGTTRIILAKIKDRPADYRTIYKSHLKDGSFGNGGLMRITPFLLWSYDLDGSSMIENIRKCLEITHLHEYSVESCIIYGKIFNYLLMTPKNHINNRQILEIAKMEVKSSQMSLKLDLIEQNLNMPFNVENYRRVASQIVQNPFHTFDTLGLVLWSFIHLDGRQKPVDMVSEIINLNYDSDTSASILSGMLGAKYGSRWIPQRWINNLENREWIMKLIKNFTILKLKNHN